MMTKTFLDVMNLKNNVGMAKYICENVIMVMPGAVENNNHNNVDRISILRHMVAD